MNKDLISTSSPTALTMTSREIAELTDKQHAHVMRDIRSMLAELHGEGGVSKFGDTHTNAQNGQSYPIFRLPKRESLILVSGYSLPMRARIIDRWQELEDAQRKPAPQVQDPQIAALVFALTEIDSLKQEQARQASQITRQGQQMQCLTENVAVIEARTQPENRHFTVMGYANLIGQSVDLGRASNLGKKCARLSRERGLPIGETRDPRFGRVFTYHDSVLETVFDKADSVGA